MTEEQRQGMIEWAWLYARPVVRRWERSRRGPDYGGTVAERLCHLIDSFDGGMSKLSTWAMSRANYACQDADRRETGIVHIPRTARHAPKMIELSRYDQTDLGEYLRSDPSFLGIADRPGHLDRMDAFRDLIRGCNQVERILLLGYYWQDQTFKEIGKSLGLSESRICQMHTHLIARFRDRLGAAPAD